MIGRDGKAVSERVPSHMIEFAVIRLRVAKHWDGRTALQLIDLLADASFDWNILRWNIKALQTAHISPPEIEGRSWRTTYFVEPRLEAILVRMTAAEHYMWVMWLVYFENRLHFSENMMSFSFWCEENALSRGLSLSLVTENSLTCYEEVKKDVIRAHGRGSV